MEKLKKLFPLSFKYNKSVGNLILCAFLYILIELAASLIIGLFIQPVLSLLFNILLSPLYIIGVFLLVIAILLCYTLIGIIVGIPLAYISGIIIAIPEVLVAIVVSIVGGFFSIYSIAGSIIAILAYAGVFGETTSVKKIEAEKKSEE